MRVDDVHIERCIPLRAQEITVRLSTDTEEGMYLFLISDQQWANAVSRGLGRPDIVDPAPPLLVAGKKEA